MKQSHYRYLGLLDLLLVAVLAAAFGPRHLLQSPVVVGMVVAGVFALLAGSVAAVSLGPLTATWRGFVGVSYGSFALAWPATYAPPILAGTATQAESVLFVVTSLGALSLLLYGVDVARDGRHFEVESDVDRVVGP